VIARIVGYEWDADGADYKIFVHRVEGQWSWHVLRTGAPGWSMLADGIASTAGACRRAAEQAIEKEEATS
jgi:hypothetical protein